MPLRLARNSDGTQPVGSTGSSITGTPIEKTVTLDGTGGTEVTPTKTFYLVATGARYYDGITVSIVSDTTDRDWEVSLDGTTFAESITVPDMDALTADQNTPFYVRATITNDGSASQPEAGTYTDTKVRVIATELTEAPA